MSSDGPARIKITIGALSIEYDGQQSFIENGLIQIAEQAYSLLPAADATRSANQSEHLYGQTIEQQSTNTIAQIISAKTGTDLALAAIAKINLVKKNSIASRSEILDEMKEATTYFKDSYASNLTSYLDSLVKSRKVNLVSRSNYALAAGERSRLEDALLGV